MGTVCLMMSKDGQIYAQKTTGGKPDMEVFLLQEIEMLKSLDHKHVVEYRGSYNEDGDIALFMENCAMSLEKLLEDPNKSEVWSDACRSYATQILSGLHYLHVKERVVHADLKPGNVLLDAHGCIKISDFGTAIRMTGDSIPLDVKIVSGMYTCPEVRVRNESYGTAADIWSFGMTLRQMVTGQPPSADPLKKCPAYLKDIIERCLEDEPSKRPSTADLLSMKYFGSAP